MSQQRSARFSIFLAQLLRVVKPGACHKHDLPVVDICYVYSLSWQNFPFLLMYCVLISASFPFLVQAGYQMSFAGCLDCDANFTS